MNDIVIYDVDFKKALNVDSRLEKLCTGAKWSEGPVYIASEDLIFWSDIPNNRLVAYSSIRGFHEYQSPSHFSNGHTIDLEGRIINCEHGRRCISRTNHNGITDILVDKWEGKRLNSPNDVVVKSDGTIWFTDPQYGIMSDEEGYQAESEIGADYVYRFDPSNGYIQAVITDMFKPNGLAFTPDEDYLYVTDTSASHDDNGYHHIKRYKVSNEDKAIIGDGEVFAVVSPGLPDGFRLDNNGWLYVSSADSIQVFHSDGRLLGKIMVPEVIANCTFGGPGFNRLYIVASMSLYSIELNVTGDIRRVANIEKHL